MNTQFTAKLKDGENSITVSYKPSEFQTGHSYNIIPITKDIPYILKIGSNSTAAYAKLAKLWSIFGGKYNIYDYLVSKGHESVDPELKLKELNVMRLLNSVPPQKLTELISVMSSAFLKEPDFYEFSLGILDVANQSIQTIIEGDFTKINRRVSPAWSANVTVETNESASSGKTSSFSFKDNYDFSLSELKEPSDITKYLSALFTKSIRPYTDIFMREFVSSAFYSLRSYTSSPTSIYSQLERLAWELYSEKGTQRYPDNITIYSNFKDLLSELNTKFPENSLGISPAKPPLYRSVTAAVTVASTSDGYSPQFDYTDFRTYYNTFHQQWIMREKKGIPHSAFMTFEEINTLISRTNRYFGVLKIGEETLNNVLSAKDTFTGFADIVSSLEENVSKYVDAVCEHYLADSEIAE